VLSGVYLEDSDARSVVGRENHGMEPQTEEEEGEEGLGTVEGSMEVVESADV
jgi:hypothetical protein